MQSAIRRLLGDERGGPLAEFALVIGLLFVFAIFAFEITRFYMRAAMAGYASHLAVRVAAVRARSVPACPM